MSFLRPSVAKALKNHEIELLPHQLDVIQKMKDQAAQNRSMDGEPFLRYRMCLYHRTGAGKTIGALAATAEFGFRELLIIAPPATHPQWVEVAAIFGIEPKVVSHAKFRQKDYKVSRRRAIIVDEFHLLGGHTGMGWKKLDGVAKVLEAALFVCSATPNYNDAERVYCVQHVLDPASCKGGYIQFLYDHCVTTENPFGKEPNVEGFRNFKDAEDYLVHLPQVSYLEDEVIKEVGEPTSFPVEVGLSPLMTEWGLNTRTQRFIASDMERRQAEVLQLRVREDGLLQEPVWNQLVELVGAATGPVLVFCTRSKVADAAQLTAARHQARSRLITGGTKEAYRNAVLNEFRSGEVDVLFATASIATGTDGLDKVCDHLILLDDTDDPSLRRQVMGRILPRGLDSDASGKQFWRIDPY